ncbi:MAG: MBL fold metallo-hydrolase [Anaerolineae bacterium]|nr:MBL fold metallo-hydrolase [Anaerolineae bacterium]
MPGSSAYVLPLGVSSALPSPGQANSYLAVVRERRYWLVDCADSPMVRLQQAGLNPLSIQGVIITHFHPDHVYGLPVFLLGLFLAGYVQGSPRQEPLPIYALPGVLKKIQAMIALYEPQRWEGMFPVAYHPIEPEIGAAVATDRDFEITAAPTEHIIPSVALRFGHGAAAFVYSSDTAPCRAVEQLAQGATLLFHEASASPNGHTFPADAGALAARSGVKELVLIHYHADNALEMVDILQAARETFAGPVQLAREFQPYPWA